MRFEGLENEIIARTGATYFAEMLIGIILAATFYYFSKIYNRHYLSTWAYSWLFYSLAAFSLGFGSWYGYSRMDAIRLTSTYITQVGNFLHVAFLLVGLLEYIRSKRIKRVHLLLILFLSLILSFTLVWAYRESTNDEEVLLRYFLRVGVRYVVVAAGFLAAGILALRSNLFLQGIGRRIFTVSFFLYALTYSYYFSVALANFAGKNFVFPFFFGMIEMVVISATGLGMVIWLLEDERERLNKINKELDSFLYSTSHDLRSPIASILGITNIARLELKEETAKRYMEMIENRVKRLDLVISDILKLSRSKKIELKIERIDFNFLLKDVIADVKFNENAPAIRLDYTENTANIFQSDYQQMKIVLGNLIANAVKYHDVSKPDPLIRVQFERHGRSVKVVVEDNGQGIRPEALPKIFDMFYRASTTSEGTGLGLYIVQEALSKIGGSINVKSEPGRGSTFTVVLNDA
ncbi:MAG: HAMP domain-containing histidine kinase [Cyclobacteriaceae bacterium]|nr:HAMP domain-containing histidine kinase [Cyclobacteriaceae bacterium]